MKNFLVAYLFTGFNTKKDINNFVKNYLKYKPGINHKLLICYKLVNTSLINQCRKITKNVNHIEFIDPSNKNDFDFGSYYRVAKKYSDYNIFFIGSHSYPIKNYWLKKITFFYKRKTIIGITASNESLLTSTKLKKVYKIFNHFFKINKLKKDFYPFPNPHIRTTSFLINAKDYLSFCKGKNFLNKMDTWIAESGKNSLTNYFKKKKYKILVVNSDLKFFTEKNWKLSNTYCYKNQDKLLISDRHCRKYHKKTYKEKKDISRKAWG